MKNSAKNNKRNIFEKFAISFRKNLKYKIIYIVLNLAFLGIIARLVSVMIINSGNTREKALDQILYVQKLAPKRGLIQDRNGSILATSTSAYQVSADLNTMRNYAVDKAKSLISDFTSDDLYKLENYVKDAAMKIGPVIGKTEEEVYDLLMYKISNEEFGYNVSLGSRIDISTLDVLKAIKKENDYGWLILNDDTKRIYPNNNLMAHVIGFTNGEEEGQYGIEYYYNDYLKGVPGVKVSEVGSDYEDLPMTSPEITNPVDGANITLTLDESIQAIIGEIAQEAMETYSAKNVTIIVSRPKNGEILGMVNLPDYNPNQPLEVDGEDIYSIWANNAIETPFEPGSTFKLVTMAAGINEGVVNDNSTFFCPGYIMVDGVKIYCANHNGHGSENLQEIMMNSCNPGFIEVGLALGIDKLNTYIKRFGLGQKTGIDLPNESPGIIKSTETVSKVDLATISMGQTNELTPIQLLNNLNTILNYGKAVTPHVVKDIKRVNSNGDIEVLYKFTEGKNEDILDDATCKTIIKQLTATVDEGGAEGAKVEGISVLGKTGTAEKMNMETGTYDNFIMSFVGAAPAENPEISVYIAVDSPVGSQYSSVVAAPMGKQVIEGVLKYLKNRPLDI